eukprot:2327750-Alexandrium_andersonii.AAC.1
MADLARTLVQRAGELADVPRFRHVCPCGRSKPCQLAMVRLDAAQYFKNADVQRARYAVRRLLRLLHRTTGCNAIRIATSGPAVGKLVRVSHDQKLLSDTVRFSDIRAAFAYAAADSLMAVGDAL